jgi:hypothetical protein
MEGGEFDRRTVHCFTPYTIPRSCLVGSSPEPKIGRDRGRGLSGEINTTENGETSKETWRETGALG